MTPRNKIGAALLGVVAVAGLAFGVVTFWPKAPPPPPPVAHGKVGWSPTWGGGTSGGGSGTVTSVTATAPFSITSTPTTTPNVTSSMATASFLGRTTAGTGAVEVLSVATTKTMLNYSTLAGTGDGADLTASSVTNAKLADMATARFKGRTTAGTGSPEDLTATQATAMLNAATTSLQGALSAADKISVNEAAAGWCATQWHVAQTAVPSLTQWRCKHLETTAPSATFLSANDGLMDGSGVTAADATFTYYVNTTFQSPKTKHIAWGARAKFLGPTSGKINETCLINAAGTHTVCIGNVFSFDTGHFMLRAIANTTTSGSSSGASDNAIHSFLVTGDTANFKLYVDGVDTTATAAVSAFSADEPLAPGIFNTTSGGTAVSDYFWAWE